MNPLTIVLVCLSVVFQVASCSSSPKGEKEQRISTLAGVSKIPEPEPLPTAAWRSVPRLLELPNPVPRLEPLSPYGNPPFYEVNGQRYYTWTNSRGYRERGIASWYGDEFHGRRTSSGEIYDMYAMTAAHRSLPLPSYVTVTNLENGRQVTVRVNDRGPFYQDRIIDLSYAAAVKLDLAQQGTGWVEVRAIELPEEGAPAGDLKTTASEQSLYLQIGAFQSRNRAEQLQKQLRSLLSAAVMVSPLESQPTAIYRVRIGPLASVKKLDTLVKELAELGFADPLVVHCSLNGLPLC
jgi:rare lipoprotein A